MIPLSSLPCMSTVLTLVLFIGDDGNSRTRCGRPLRIRGTSALLDEKIPVEQLLLSLWLCYSVFQNWTLKSCSFSCMAYMRDPVRCTDVAVVVCTMTTATPSVGLYRTTYLVNNTVARSYTRSLLFCFLQDGGVLSRNDGTILHSFVVVILKSKNDGSCVAFCAWGDIGVRSR